MATSKNKLIPVLVTSAALIVGYVFYSRWTSEPGPVASGNPLNVAPLPGVDPNAPATSTGIFGGAPLPPVTSADADNSNETLAQVTASNRELRAAVQKVIESNETLRRENDNLRNSDDDIIKRVRGE